MATNAGRAPSDTTGRGRRLRLLLAGLALLVAACSGDDGGKEGGARPSSTAGPGSAGDPCSLLDARALGAVTGVEFDGAEAQAGGCVYTSSAGAAAITLTYAALEEDVEPEHAIAQAKLTCDEGTVQELEFTDALGYGCLVHGVASVAAVGDGTFAVLVGATADPAAGTARILQDLATLLEDAITA